MVANQARSHHARASAAPPADTDASLGDAGSEANRWAVPKYRGDRLTIAMVLSAKLPGMARRRAARYPVGREVDVHYDPKMPSESVLRWFSLLHLIMFVAAAAVLWPAWRGGDGGE